MAGDGDAEMGREQRQLLPRCVASSALALEPETSIYRSAAWSADGTCVVTTSDDMALRTYVLPPDLLKGSSPIALEPFYTSRNPEPVHCAALYPYYDLSNPRTTLALSSITEHPIRLCNTLHGALHASYPLVNFSTEEYIAPHSLLFSTAGSHFIAGSDSLLTIFDVSRPGDGPLERHSTIPSKRKKIVGGGVGIKGIVSALATSSEGLLAAGTFTRCIGLYNNEGRGGCVSVFSLAGEDAGIGGAGVTQTLWSPCGRYLYIVERQSDGIITYDVRVSGRKLGILRGRKAVTNQRMNVDVVPTDAGHELWAGGTDGCVRLWENPHHLQDTMVPCVCWNAHNDAVSSVKFHHKGSVAVTCSGQRQDMHSRATSTDFDEHAQLPTTDFSMKIWSL